MGRLSGKVAVVIGSAFRIWKAVAELYMKEGANVIVANSGFPSAF